MVDTSKVATSASRRCRSNSPRTGILGISRPNVETRFSILRLIVVHSFVFGRKSMRAFRRLLCVSFVLSSLVLPLGAAVTGTVINIDGKAVTGAKVSLFAPELIASQGPRFQSAEPQRKPLATIATNSGGKFTFDVPKDQTVVDVRVEAAGYAPAGIRLNAA